ncbi:hypothetical protein KI387_007443, partial [Taxus chinensis]
EALWPLGAAIRGSSFLRNRMLADPSFLFKVFTEIMIDSCCATFAEVQKRGKDFWSEFELYLADLLVGIVVDVALVGMLAPFVRFGQPTITAGLGGRINHAIGSLPSSVFEAEMPGRRFSVQQRIGTYFFKGIQYGAVGFVCGIIGQGIANSIMILKRKFKKSGEHDVPVPPLIQSAALWGVFLAVSSNTRYQIINGLECVVEGSLLAKRVPPIALAFTVGIRFANNVYGGMQFVDWARWSGAPTLGLFVLSHLALPPPGFSRQPKPPKTVIAEMIRDRLHLMPTSPIFLSKIRTIGDHSRGFCLIYDSNEDALKYEPPHKLRRMGIPIEASATGQNYKKRAKKIAQAKSKKFDFKK